MSYLSISVREAMEKINSLNGGWYLPEVQRQYVWGARHESEDYICLLLDSLLRGYPIGGIVLWETTAPVPFRPFLGDYLPGNFSNLVPEDRRKAHKSLVYDGQQRLQTLYTVLYHFFNGRVLHYDLLFNRDAMEADDTGFHFRDAKAPPLPRYLPMPGLTSLSGSDDENVDLEERVLVAAGTDPALQRLIRINLKGLWNIFVRTDVKSLAYFPVRSEGPEKVNEVFRRLNTGGVALTQTELILSEIKAIKSEYEQQLWQLSALIKKESDGIEFGSGEVLQFFHLLVKQTIRIDESRFKSSDVPDFVSKLTTEADVLVELFRGYLGHLFKINNRWIIPSIIALMPIGTYLSARKQAGHPWRIRDLDQANLELIHHFFLSSQFCDWSTQTMVNSFARLSVVAGKAGAQFPLAEIRTIAVAKNRIGHIRTNQFLSEPWLATKVLMPTRQYVFADRKPQVDHIFPKGLEKSDDAYRRLIDVVWNFQPIPAEINLHKSNRHPREYFNSEDGQKYRVHFDFIPDSESPLWDDPASFIAYRETAMREELRRLYGIELEAYP